MTSRKIVSAAIAAAIVVGAAATAAAQPVASERLSLTLADAVQRGLAHNADLAIVRFDTEVEAARVGESRGAHSPVFSTTAGSTRTVTPPSSALLGDGGIDVNDWFSSTGVRQRVPWGGGTWSVSWDTARTTSTNLFNAFDPNLQSGIQAAF